MEKEKTDKPKVVIHGFFEAMAEDGKDEIENEPTREDWEDDNAHAAMKEERANR